MPQTATDTRYVNTGDDPLSGAVVLEGSVVGRLLAATELTYLLASCLNILSMDVRGEVVTVRS